MSGGDHIREDNERFGPTAACSLEGRNEVGFTVHWEGAGARGQALGSQL